MSCTELYLKSAQPSFVAGTLDRARKVQGKIRTSPFLPSPTCVDSNCNFLNLTLSPQQRATTPLFHSFSLPGSYRSSHARYPDAVSIIIATQDGAGSGAIHPLSNVGYYPDILGRAGISEHHHRHDQGPSHNTSLVQLRATLVPPASRGFISWPLHLLDYGY